MTDRDPSPQDILAQMVSEAGDDAVGEWRVRIPTPTPLVRQPPSFAVAVEIARQALTASAQAGGGSREAEALSGLLTEVLGRHEFERCACKTYPRTVDLICQHAQDLATAIAGF